MYIIVVSAVSAIRSSSCSYRHETTKGSLPLGKKLTLPTIWLHIHVYALVLLRALRSTRAHTYSQKVSKIGFLQSKVVRKRTFHRFNMLFLIPAQVQLESGIFQQETVIKLNQLISRSDMCIIFVQWWKYMWVEIKAKRAATWLGAT